MIRCEPLFVDGLLDLTLNSSQCELVQTPMPGFGVHLRCRLEPTEEDWLSLLKVRETLS